MRVCHGTATVDAGQLPIAAAPRAKLHERTDTYVTLEGQLKLWHTAAQTVAHPCLGVGLAEAKGGLFTARKAARNGREKSTRLGAPLPACAPAVSTRRLRFDSSSLKIGTVQHKCGMRRTRVRAFAPREQQALPSQKRKPDTPKTLTPRKTSFVYKRLLSLSLRYLMFTNTCRGSNNKQTSCRKSFCHTRHTHATHNTQHTPNTHTHTHTHTLRLQMEGSNLSSTTGKSRLG